MACQNPLSTYSLLPSPCKSYTSVVHFSSSPLISRCFVFSFIRAFSPPTERRLISSISPLTLKLHFSYPHRPSTAAPTSPRILRKAAEYVFPDPIPEFAEAETSKFRDHLFERLSKKDIFEDSLDEIVRICAEVSEEHLFISLNFRRSSTSTTFLLRRPSFSPFFFSDEWVLNLVEEEVMESGIWVQQHLDDTLLFTYSSVTTAYAYTPWMHYSVPTPWMNYSVPSPQIMRPSNPSHRRRRPHRYEVPLGMRSAAANASFNDTTLELQNLEILNERNEREEYVSDFLLSCVGRLSEISEENIICTICQDEINLEEEIVTLSCSHIYHGSCIEEWLMIKNDCPVCRASVIPDDDDN